MLLPMIRHDTSLFSLFAASPFSCLICRYAMMMPCFTPPRLADDDSAIMLDDTPPCYADAEFTPRAIISTPPATRRDVTFALR